MTDLEKAKSLLSQKILTLSIVKNNEIIYETRSHGIYGFLEATEKLGFKLEGASIADRIVGKAIALLCVYMKVKAVYAEVLSKKAKAAFEVNMVYHEWKDLVGNILNVDKTGICPYEKMAAKIVNPKDSLKQLKALQSSHKN